MKALIDSDVLLDFLDGFPPAGLELSRYRERCVSVISWIELMVGAKTAAEEEIRRAFLNHFQVLPLTSQVAEETVILRRKYRVKLPDAIIWATAIVENCLLVSRNRKHFPADHPGVRFPYRR
jgi:predicted nucleic acid-binding protein